MEVLLWLIAFALWFIVGLILCLYIESRPRFHKLYDPFGSTVVQLLIVLLFPVSLPLLTWRHARAAR